MTNFDWTVEMLKGAYVKVMGEAKWNSLNDSQKHDVIMILARDLKNALENALERI